MFLLHTKKIKSNQMSGFKSDHEKLNQILKRPKSKCDVMEAIPAQIFNRFEIANPFA